MQLLLATFAAGGLITLLFKIAIVCVIAWGIIALLQWLGVTIPEPIRIVLIVLVCIIVLYWLYELFTVALP